MPLAYARSLTSTVRTHRGNLHLGVGLAFVAGATNAGAFLAVGQYTSHMTGIVSTMADAIVLRQWPLAISGLVAVLAFLAGSATSAVLINFARRRSLRSEFAQPLLLEAALLLAFGAVAPALPNGRGVLIAATVALLCFIMGLQNAVITKISNSVIRTTHVTGLITDLGIEFGRMAYVNRNRTLEAVTGDRTRATVLAALLGSFFIGGVAGALGFMHVGYATTVPLALLLLLMAFAPAVDDMRGALSRRDSNNQP